MTRTFIEALALAVAVIGAAGVGYKEGRKSVVCPAATQRIAQRDLTARRIVSTVTKYVTVPVSTHTTRVPVEITKTVIEHPKEINHESESLTLAPTSSLARYSLGLGCMAWPCNRLSALEMQVSARLGDLPLHIYTSFQPNNTSLSIGLRYDF